VLALANTAVQIVSKLDASAKEAGQQIPDDILYHAGSEIVGMLAEVAEAANIHNYSEDEIQGAFFQAVDQYRPIAEADGRTDQNTLKRPVRPNPQRGCVGAVGPSAARSRRPAAGR
jgi:hypothetical protein